MRFNSLLEVVLVVCIMETISAKPFLPASPLALTKLVTSASASASASNSETSSSSSNIANLTRKRQEKAQLLQSEKQLAEDDNFPDDEPEDEERNEASPSLLQKKISKILTKIRLLTSLSTAPELGEATNSMEFHSESDVVGDVSTQTAEVKSPTLQKVIYPHKNSAPLRLSLKIGEEVGVDERNDEEMMVAARSSQRIGQIGVFFAELFGSLVGLAYGAVAHLNNAVQGVQESTNI